MRIIRSMSIIGIAIVILTTVIFFSNVGQHNGENSYIPMVIFTILYLFVFSIVSLVKTKSAISLGFDWAKELKDIKKLKDEGILTDEEYNNQKMRILG